MKRVVLLLLILAVLAWWLASRSKTTDLQSKLTDFGTVVDERIDLRQIDDFLTREQCESLIALAEPGFAPSTVIKDSTRTTDRSRTSWSFAVPNDAPHVSDIRRKVAQLTGVPDCHIEQLQVVRYQPGQYFEPHHDWYQPDYQPRYGNQRLYTFLTYLNDVEEAGETKFPKLGKEFRPKTGRALFWKNCTDLQDCSILSLHQGTAPTTQTKFALNGWVTMLPLK